MHDHRRTARSCLSGAIREEFDDIIKESNLLPEEQEIIMLKFGKDWSIVKIAQHMNISERSVNRRIENAYEKIHKVLLKKIPP
ncbi:MAG: sigma-70 family RNA polymerase sigma factor [Bacteroidales bacterium]|nr:sigma-70 family RNA polymerase sigma factor [Bacteroidales bacterium]